MNSLSLKNKLIVLISVLLFFCAMLGTVGYVASEKISDSHTQIEIETLPNIMALYEGLAHMRAARIYLVQLALPNLTDTEIKDLRARVPEEIEKYNVEDKKYTDVPFGGPEEAGMYKSMKEKMDLIKADINKALDLHAKSNGKEGPAMEEMRHLLEGPLMVHGKEFRDELNKILDYQKNEVKEGVEKAHLAKKSGTTWIIVGLLGALILGGIISFIVMKNIIADQAVTAKAMEDAVRSFNVLESSPNPTMMCDLSGKLIYINKCAVETFRTLEKYLPVKADQLLGKTVDAFHKDPGLTRKIISNHKNLPYKAIIEVGPEKMDLVVSASLDGKGNYIGATVTWNMITQKVNLIRNLTNSAEDLAIAASNVLGISSNLSAAAEETSAQANTASVASEEVNAGVQTVASNMGEMVFAIKEITKTTNEAASVANDAMTLAKNANELINKLGDSSMDIGNVIKVISSIAQQTNLLALNATIEAARAGEAGKGFAVVANEVKELAKQTAKATGEITQKIEAIQGDSKGAVDAIAAITIAIEKVHGFTGNIAASIEEQAATTNEVTRIVTESAEGVKQISENVAQVSQAAANTGRDAGKAQAAAKGVGDTAELLKRYVDQLKA